MKKKRVLTLNASEVQMPIIDFCHKSPYIQLITIDNNPDNPGHKLADESYFIDVYEPYKIINTLKNNPPEVIIPYASSHGLESISIIGEYFNIPHIDLKALQILLSKSLFRNFLRENNLPFPKYITYNQKNKPYSKLPDDFTFPIIIKPTDSGANKGITKVETRNKQLINEAISYAFDNSPTKNVIVEEFISSKIKINGDGFMQNGKLIYSLLGDYIYNEALNPILPIGTSFPTKYRLNLLNKEIEHLLNLVGFENGAFNVEAIIKDNKIYFVEFNPRHSGNYIFELITYNLPISAEEINYKIFTNEYVNSDLLFVNNKKTICFIIASEKKGILKEIKLSKKLKQNLISSHLFIETEEKVNIYRTLSDRLGILLIDTDNFSSIQEIHSEIEIIYK